MIAYVTGDLLLSGEKFIVHCCNAQGAFGSGFAGAVRKMYPDCYGLYMSTYNKQGNEYNLGQVVVYENVEDGRIIFNLIGQQYYGYDAKTTGKVYVSYEALREGFKRVREFMVGRDLNRISMPLIGADRAGGDWKIISSIIEEEFEGFEIFVYTLTGNIPG